MDASPLKRPLPNPPPGRGALVVRCTACALALAGALSAAIGCVGPEGEVRLVASSEFECATSKVKVERLGQSRFEAKGCDRSEQYTCAMRWEDDGSHALVCERELQPSPPERGAPPRITPAPLLGPPSGAAGFVFGAHEDDVRRTCESAGHVYASEAPGVASCEGVAAAVGISSRALLGFCAGALCSVSLLVKPAANETLGVALARWKAALVEKYGGPSAPRAYIPSRCVDDVTPCLVDRSAMIRFDWQWKSRQGISLATEAENAHGAAVVITYVAPPTGSAKTTGL